MNTYYRELQQRNYFLSLFHLRVLFFFASAFALLHIGSSSIGGLVPFAQFSSCYYYFFIGIIAATVANATGAGGGIVFLPVFISLGMQANESLTTSLAIQCFGMSSGALAWLAQRQHEQSMFARQWKGFVRIVIAGGLSSVLGLLSAQAWLPHPPVDVEVLFSVFSLCVGTIILLRTLLVPLEKKARETNLNRFELIGLVLACSIGGAITAWLSVGVGEILAIYLIFLGFRVNMAVAAAVCVTALSVIPAMPHHLLAEPSPLRYEVFVFAVPGALVGGAIAKKLAVYLGAHRLKLVMSVWIILSACLYLVGPEK